MEEKARQSSGLWTKRLIAAASLLLFTIMPTTHSAAEPKQWMAGNFTFSDELGGFKIRAIRGKGTQADPIVIDQELYSASPVTMVIRSALLLGRFDAAAADLGKGALHIELNVHNAGGQGWVEFELELQEVLGRASIFSDGLSFDQRLEDKKLVSFTGFTEFRRDFEPYDQLRFINGKVDTGETASFGFALTDFTPKLTFYLVEDPRIPSS